AFLVRVRMHGDMALGTDPEIAQPPPAHVVELLGVLDGPARRRGGGRGDGMAPAKRTSGKCNAMRGTIPPAGRTGGRAPFRGPAPGGRFPVREPHACRSGTVAATPHQGDPLPPAPVGTTGNARFRFGLCAWRGMAAGGVMGTILAFFAAVPPVIPNPGIALSQRREGPHMAAPSLITVRRFPHPMRLRLQVLFAKAFESLADTYRLQATEFVRRLRGRMSVEEALDRYFREVGVPHSMEQTV